MTRCAPRLGAALAGVAYVASSCLPAAANGASLPLSLKLWSLSQTKTIVCTGKSWVSLAAGTLQRNAYVVVMADANPSHNDSLLACDDGAGSDAPITGDTGAAQAIKAGQTVLQGTFDVIFLRVRAAQGAQALIALEVNSLNGQVMLASKRGQGMIHIAGAKGIEVYPPSYAIDSVDESVTYRLAAAPSAPVPCVVTYFADDPNGPKKQIRTNVDCATLVHQVGTDAIFSGKIPMLP